METKLFEVLDHATCMVMVATRMAPNESQTGREQRMLQRAGYSSALILLGTANGGPFCYDPYDWGNERTRFTAHKYIADNWNNLENGDMVDVRFILGETTEPGTTDI